MQTDSFYAGRTALLLTTAHGRGTGAEGWKNHGVDLPGSEQMWIAGLGPGIAPRGVREGCTATQAQTAATAAALVGCDFTQVDERIAVPIVWDKP